MSELENLESIGPDATGLRISMVWENERFKHCVDWVAGDQAFRILESVEGDEKELWPPSPALQQLTLEQRTQSRQVGLMVGMAGNSHWSVAIENDPRDKSMLFEAACRVADTTAGSLTTTYKSMVPVKIVDPIERVAELSIAGRKCRIKVESTGRGELDELKIEGNIITITPTEMPETWPATVEWKYRLFG